MIYRADVIVLAGFNVLYLSDFGPLNHCRDFVLISNLDTSEFIALLFGKHRQLNFYCEGDVSLNFITPKGVVTIFRLDIFIRVSCVCLRLAYARNELQDVGVGVPRVNFNVIKVHFSGLT